MHGFDLVLQRLTAGLPGVRGLNASGLYLYGSAGTADFVPPRSDVDLILTTTRRIDDQAFETLRTWLSEETARDPGFEGLQMTILVQDRVLEDDPSGCLYQFGRLSRSGSDGNPIIWLDFLQRGRVLFGPDPRSFLPTITPAVLRRALIREIGYLREEFALGDGSEWISKDSYRAYAVLTLCRILYTRATGEVIGKAGAAAWAVDRVPERFRPIIDRAARCSARAEGEAPGPHEIDLFIDYTHAALEEDEP